MERAIEGTPSRPSRYLASAEVELFEAAHAARLPVMLKGPTGCGKTRFVEHMAWRLSRPLITVACHEDLSATDLVGRFLLEGDETIWHDGPLTAAVRGGAICYLDEVVEARKDTVVIIHPLTDDRRRLPIEKRGTVLDAPPDFMLVVSYNPGYQSILKDLKQSTRQRFVALELAYPPPEPEAEIVAREGGADLQRREPRPPARRSEHPRPRPESASPLPLIYSAPLTPLPPRGRRRGRPLPTHLLPRSIAASSRIVTTVSKERREQPDGVPRYPRLLRGVLDARGDFRLAQKVSEVAGDADVADEDDAVAGAAHPRDEVAQPVYPARHVETLIVLGLSLVDDGALRGRGAAVELDDPGLPAVVVNPLHPDGAEARAPLRRARSPT